MIKFAISSLVFLFAFTASAETIIPVQARLNIGLTTTSPTEVDNVLSTQGMAKIANVNQASLEMTYPVLHYLDLGLRYTKRFANFEEDPANAATDYSTKVDQDSMMAIARVPVFKTEFVRIDGFAGFGGSNTTLTLKSSGQDGELTKKAGAGWFATPYSAVGASVAVGYKQFFFVFEGGYESNKVDGFSRSGNVSSSINTLDLSGSYVTIGLMFNGVNATVGGK